jgi:hypothetical protein
MLALIVVFVGLELQGLRVKTASELAYWGRAPVVAATSWPLDSSELPAVISELAEAASLAGGRTLVVSASEHEEDAERIGEALGRAVAQEESLLYELEPIVDRPWAAEAPDEEVIVTEPPRGSDLALSPKRPSRLGPGTGSSRALEIPGLAHREERVITRRRGGRLERVQVAAQRLVLDEEHEPAQVLTHSHESGKAFARRTSRAADRVLIVARSGELTWARASQLRAMVGREDDGVAFVLVGVPVWLAPLADRAGPVASFWRTLRAD